VRDVAGDPLPVAPFIIELIRGGVVLAWVMSSTELILLAVIMHGTHNMSQQACSPFGAWHRSTQMPCAPLNLHQRVMHCLDQCLTELSELGDAHETAARQISAIRRDIGSRSHRARDRPKQPPH